MMKIVDLDVSRETFSEMEMFVQLVNKWTPSINLISKQSIPDIWERHVVDSAQIFELSKNRGHWVDLGSGGGFPGIVAAILSKGKQYEQKFTLVESDKRKCAFLRTVVRELDLNTEVLSERIEHIPCLKAETLTARALTDLGGLLAFGNQHLVAGGTAIFLKGETWQKEHQEAKEHWSYKCEAINSRTKSGAAVLKIQDIQRV